MKNHATRNIFTQIHRKCTFEVRNGLCGNPVCFVYRRGRARFSVVELAGVAMFHPQRRNTPTGARCVHHELVVLQHTHFRPEHAVHFSGDRKKPAAFWGLPVPHGQLSGDLSDSQQHAEHGSPQYRPLDRRGLPAELLQQDALPGRAGHGVLLVASLVHILPHPAAFLLV